MWSQSSAWLPSDLKAVAGDNSCTLPEASGSAPQEIDPSKENQVLFTYSVQWEVGAPEGGFLGLWELMWSCVLQASEVKWASRWDTYLTMSDVQIHWFSIVNSVVVVFFLSGEALCSSAPTFQTCLLVKLLLHPPPRHPQHDHHQDPEEGHRQLQP